MHRTKRRKDERQEFYETVSMTMPSLELLKQLLMADERPALHASVAGIGVSELLAERNTMLNEHY